jgi:type IV secretion system protein VirB10
VTRATTATARRLADPTFTLPKGTAIGCILDTAIQSDQAGLTGCTLPRDVYGADGTVVLLDRGSQVLGEYRSATLTYGKRRIFVVWDRVRTPEGVIVDIASPGTGPLGQAGMGGHINNHYWERVGIPVLMSAVSFGAESYAREQLTSDQARYIEGATNDTLSGVLAELAKIKPTLHKNQGDPINIVVARDLDLSPVYELRRRGHGR